MRASRGDCVGDQGVFIQTAGVCRVFNCRSGGERAHSEHAVRVKTEEGSPNTSDFGVTGLQPIVHRVSEGEEIGDMGKHTSTISYKYYRNNPFPTKSSPVQQMERKPVSENVLGYPTSRR